MLKRLVIVCLLILAINIHFADSAPEINIKPAAEFSNATLIVITNAYFHVEKYDGKIVMHDFRYPHLPGIFIIIDKNGIEAFNIAGGWRAYIEIYGFKGFFNEGTYITLIGKCDKITITPVR
ncbi:MAG: hypothetical protein FE045_00425 [Thermoplasmata archaeon]|nr:MAG: hypothetical protein FE045_00425 [Thermoplasmata archaeon]